MARIREYQQKNDPYANDPTRRASGADMGAQVGEALAGFGGAVISTGQTLNEVDEQREITRQYTDFAKAQADWTQNFHDRLTQTPADDRTFAPKLAEDMRGYFEKMRDNYKTRRGQENFDRLAAQMTSHFQIQGINAQAAMAGEQAKTDWLDLSDSLARVAMADQTAVPLALDHAKQALNDPNGLYAKSLTTQQRDELLQNFTKEVAFAAGKGEALRNPEHLLSNLAPEEAAKFSSTQSGANAGAAASNRPVVGFTAPLKADKLAPYAKVIDQSGAQYGVDANFMRAQLMAESAGNPAAVSPAGAIGIAQFIPETARRYGIDPTDPAQAIQGQARYMADLLNMFGGDYRKAAAAYNWGEGNLQDAISKHGENWLAFAPKETQGYVARIFETAMPIVSLDDGVKVADGSGNEPVRSDAMPVWFNELDWKQQYDIIGDAKQGVRANIAARSQALELAEKERKAQQRVISNEFIDKAISGTLTVSEIKGSGLDYEGKEHFLNVIQSDLQGRTKTDPALFWDLYQRVQSEPGAPGHISDENQILAYGGRGLNFEDIKRLTGELQGRGSMEGKTTGDLKKAFFDGAKSQISKTTLTDRDAVGDGLFYQFQVAAMMEYDRKVKAGVSPMELFNPSSKEYLGNLIPLYARTAQQALKDQANALRQQPGSAMFPLNKAPAARQPGESVEDYLKRTSQ